MSILYAVISQGPVVLVRYASCVGNFQEVADQIISKVDVESDTKRMSYTHGHYLTHYVISDGIIYLCITDDLCERHFAFLFLEDIKKKFEVTCKEAPRDPQPYVWNEDFAEVLCLTMRHHNSRPETDVMSVAQSQMEELQQTLVRNIEELTSRGERLELLVDKTRNLDTSSVIFRVQAQQVAQRAWWRNAKAWVIIVVVLAFSVYLFGAAVCGWSWGKCSSSK